MDHGWVGFLHLTSLACTPFESLHDATLSEQMRCDIADGVVMKAASQQLQYNIRDGQVQTEEFLEGQRNENVRFLPVITKTVR